MSSGGFDYSDFKKFYNDLKKMRDDSERFCKQFVLQMAYRAIAIAKKNTPTDTHLLRNSWNLGDGVVVTYNNFDEAGKEQIFVDNISSKSATVASVTKVGNDFVIYVFNPCEYALYVEYGHVTRDREKYVEGFFMLTIAINKVEKELPKRFEKAFKEWVKSLGLDK